MKRKTLLLAIAMIACAWGSLYAQKDVTSQYITNATLSNGLTGWTNVNFNDPVSGNGERDIVGNNEAEKSYNTVGFATECYAGWGSLEKDNYSLTQTITLPAGHYTLVNYSFFRYGLNADTNPDKSLAFLKAGDQKVAINTLGGITCNGYANSQIEGAVAFDSKMYRKTLDFTIAADNTPIEIGLEGTFDLKQSWIIAGMFELIDNDQKATMDSPFDVTGKIINPGFEYRDMSGWTVNPGGYFGTQVNDQGFKTGFYYAEKWQPQASGALPGGTMSQTLTDLPAGFYKLTANLGGNGTFIDLNGKTAQWTADGNYTVGYVLAEDEDLTITAGKTEEGTANWVHFDNFKLSFCGDVAKALTDLCAKVTEYQSKLPEAAYTQLYNNVAEYNQTYTDVDELLAAIDAVQKLYDAADALVPVIDDYNAALQRAKTAVATTDKIWEQLRENLSSIIEANDPVAEQTSEAYTAATDALNDGAAAVEKSVASYKIIASGEVPTNIIDGWKTENSNILQVNNWSTEADNTGMVTPFIENWVYRDSYLGNGRVYYTLEGLTPGEIYYAQALVRAYSEVGNVPTGPDFFINDVVTDMTSAGTPFSYNDMQGYFGTLGGAAIVGEDGKISLGVVISNANYNWVAFKDVHIQSMDDALQAAIDKVEAFYEKVPVGVKTAAETMIAGYNNLTTTAQYEAAIQALTEKAEEMAAIAVSYEKYLALKDYCDALLLVESDNAAKKQELAGYLESNETSVNNATTQNEIDELYASLKGEMTDYANASNPTEGNQFDLTFMLTNPNLDGLPNGAKPEGWASEETDGNSQVMTNDSKTNGDKKTFFEYWSSTAKASDKFALYLTVELPEGIYKMSCYAFAEDQNANNTKDGVWFYANDKQGTAITSTKLEPANIEFVNTEEGEVKIGLKTTAGNTRNWMGIGYVELYKLNNVKTATLADTDTKAPAAGAYTSITYDRTLKKGLNTLVLPFQTTKDEIGASKVLQFEGAEKEDENSTKVVLEFSVTDNLSPNTPYVVITEDEVTLPTFENKTVSEPTDLTVAGTEFSFVGTYKDGTDIVEAGDYIANASQGKFLKAAGGNRLKAYRAYLKKMTENTPDNELNVSVDGEFVDGIMAVEILREMGVENIYNLNGQKVSHTQKGVYIVNGRKVVVK